MELSPTKDVNAINALMNDPSIKPWICGNLVGVLDISPLVNEKNIFFVDEHGGCALIYMSDGIYDLHSFVLPSGRGRWVKKNFDAVKGWMFANTNCERIITLCPTNNGMAVGAARFCGFKKYGTIANAWEHDGEIYDIDTYVLYKEVK